MMSDTPHRVGWQRFACAIHRIHAGIAQAPGGPVDNPRDSPYTRPIQGKGGRPTACIRTEVVKIRACCPDPLETHRVGPGIWGAIAVFAYCGRALRF
jgi:hypothetical protein